MQKRRTLSNYINTDVYPTKSEIDSLYNKRKKMYKKARKTVASYRSVRLALKMEAIKRLDRTIVITDDMLRKIFPELYLFHPSKIEKNEVVDLTLIDRKFVYEWFPKNDTFTRLMVLDFCIQISKDEIY